MNFSDILKQIKKRLTLSNILLLILFGTLFYLLKFCFSDEIIATGDLPGHYYLCEKMLEYLQQFRISGYDPNWFGGYPVFTFYNPLPYITVCFLHLITFKSLSLIFCFNLILFILPFLFLVSIYYTASIFFKNSKANILALFLGYLVLLETLVGNYGLGLIAEFSAGFFSNAFAWPIFIFLIGIIEKFRQTNNRKYLFLSIGLFSILILSHIFTTIFAVIYLFLYTVFYFKSFWKKGLIIFLSSLLVTAFWWVPFLLNINLTSGEDYSGMIIGDPIMALYSQPILGFFLFAFTIIGIVRLIKEKNSFLPIFFLFSLILLPRNIINQFIQLPIHWYRFTAGIIVINIFISAYGLKYILDNYIELKLNFRQKNFTIKLIICWVFFIGILVDIIPHFNFGFYKKIYAQSRQYAKENKEILDFLNSNKNNKVFIDDTIVFFGGSGGPHYENMQLGLNKTPLLGGLIHESSLSFSYYGPHQEIFRYEDLISNEIAPYDYIQSAKSKYAFQNIELDNLIENISDKNSEKIKSIIKKLSVYGVKYILTNNAHHTPILDFANSSFNNNLISIKKEISPYVIIEINDEPQSLISSTDYNPFLFIQSGPLSLNFKEFSKKWYENNYAINHPILHTEKSFKELSDYELSRIKGYIISTQGCPTDDMKLLTSKNKPVIVIGAQEDCKSNSNSIYFVARKNKIDINIDREQNDLKIKEKSAFYGEIYDIIAKYNLENIKLEKINPEVSEDEYIKFSSNSNILINYSYFPKWKSKDENQTVFWATPSFMFIFGRGNTELRYK
ncbi:MAG: hypothetical protein PHR47_01910 [Candidatus Pacebacteria bacterium]|nr:hypothetical protein [Candidatus Paceibacterota bacterium]